MYISTWIINPSFDFIECLHLKAVGQYRTKKVWDLSRNLAATWQPDIASTIHCWKYVVYFRCCCSCFQRITFLICAYAVLKEHQTSTWFTLVIKQKAVCVTPKDLVGGWVVRLLKMQADLILLRHFSVKYVIGFSWLKSSSSKSSWKTNPLWKQKTPQVCASQLFDMQELYTQNVFPLRPKIKFMCKFKPQEGSIILHATQVLPTFWKQLMVVLVNFTCLVVLQTLTCL